MAKKPQREHQQWLKKLARWYAQGRKPRGKKASNLPMGLPQCCTEVTFFTKGLLQAVSRQVLCTRYSSEFIKIKSYTRYQSYKKLHPRLFGHPISLLGLLWSSTTNWVAWTTGIYYLTVLKASDPKWRCDGVGSSSWELRGKGLFQASLLGFQMTVFMLTWHSPWI